MRIIDKNTDFYDYLQNVYHDDSITFDRTDSFVLTKDIMCRYLYQSTNRPEIHDCDFVLLQVCNTFWLFLTDLTAIDKYNNATDYDIELLTTWKNYNKNRELIKLDVISLEPEISRSMRGYAKRSFYYSRYKYDREKIINKLDTIVQAIDTNSFHVKRSINKQLVRVGDGTWIEKHIPLLKACGVAKLIDPLKIYLALEEYFSREKTAFERAESVGITDKEKIENHGFDIKTSFRGK